MGSEVHGQECIGVTANGQFDLEIEAFMARLIRSLSRVARPFAGDELHAYTEHTVTKMEVHVDYSQIITIDPERRSGKPCIRGLRITVYDVLDYLAGGMTHEEILADFPDLTETDIRACLAFAADAERKFEIVTL
jgi:uncharacterized protein (DUF433 family)